jgi:hypothetical protein
VKVALGAFASSGIKARLGTDTPTGVQAALFHYTRRLKSGWTPVGFPQFRQGQALQDPEAPFELPVDPETRSTLELEAERQGTTVEELAVHAVLVYLADLDSSTPARPRPLAVPDVLWASQSL